MPAGVRQSYGVESRDITVGGRIVQARVVVASGAVPVPIFYPSVSGYDIYDDALYYLMTSDQERNTRYEDAIQRTAAQKTVVDIGTGADVNWARCCIDAGATKVYAIEAIPATFEQAKETVARLGLGARIQLLQGLSTEVEIPEKVDLCVSEIIDSIGGHEGVATVLNDARRRFLKAGGIMIPQRCTTYIAAAQLPDNLAEQPAFSLSSHYYMTRIFEKVGRPFDPLLCISYVAPENLLSNAAVFEDLEFEQETRPEYQGAARLGLQRAGRFDGLLLWIRLWCHRDSDPIDSSKDHVNWTPVFFPAGHPGVEVTEGDLLDLSWEAWTSDNRINPNYRIQGTLSRSGSKVHSFDYQAAHHGSIFKQNGFFDKLFS